MSESTPPATPSEESLKVADGVMALNYPKTPARENIARIADEAFSAIRAQAAMADFIRKHCNVVFWPRDGAYPIEHAPGANKDSWALLEQAFEATKSTKEATP